jgi:prevent-host-death family protein
METRPVTKLIDALTVRTRFGEIMETVEREQVRYVVSRRGKAKMVLMSVRDYLKNIVKKPDILVQIQMDAKKSGRDTISDQEIEAEIAAYRKSIKK